MRSWRSSMRWSVLVIAGLAVAGIGGKRGSDDPRQHPAHGDGSAIADQVVLFTDPAAFDRWTGAEPLGFPPDAALAFPDQPLGAGLVDYSCTDALAGVDLPFGALVPTANLSAPDAAWLCALGPLWNGGPANIDPQPVSPTFVVDGEDDFELVFDPPVYAVGLDLLTNFVADHVLTVELEDGAVVVFDDPELDTLANERAFLGVKSRRGIVAVSLDGEGGAVQNEGLEGVASADFFQVRIDVMPGNARNPINCKSRGKTKVAILSEPGFLAPREVDPATLRFGATGSEPSLAFCKGGKDENRDRLPDLTCHFHTPIADLCAEPLSGEAILTGVTWDGAPIAGSDAIWIVPGSFKPGGKVPPVKPGPSPKPPKPGKGDDGPGKGVGNDGPGNGKGVGKGRGNGNGPPPGRGPNG